MNRKIGLILIIMIVGVLAVFVFITNSSQKDIQVLELNPISGVKITAPIRFTASENVTAIDFKVIGNIVSVICVADDFDVVSQNKDGCVLANFDGGMKSAVVGSITFIEDQNQVPVVSGIVANINGDNAKDAKISIEY